MEKKENENKKLFYNDELQEIILDYNEYFILSENIIYKIIIIKYKDTIVIETKNYTIKFNLNIINNIIKIQFNDINEAYDFLMNKFDENKVDIKNENNSKCIKLFVIVENEKKIEIELSYITKKENTFVSRINNMQKEINILKEENTKLYDEINKLKQYHDDSYPRDIEFSIDLSRNPNAYINLDNTFTVYKSINNILYLIHSDVEQSIICYDLNNLRKVTELKYTHMKPISSFRHFSDEKNKKDLIMSISCDDNSIKIWDTYNWECLFDIMNINKEGDLYSACFLKEKDNIYIVTSNRNKDGALDKIKIYNFYGKIIQEMDNSNENTLFLDSYFDKKLSKNYIISANFGNVKSYDYLKNEIYHIYNDDDFNRGHYSVIIKDYENIVHLYESCTDGKIRIWNFHEGTLLTKIKVSDEGLRGICLWDDNNIFVGCDDKTIKLVDIKKKFIIKNLDGHNNKVITLKKIIHPKYGECLISQAFKKDKIKLWKNKNNLSNYI